MAESPRVLPSLTDSLGWIGWTLDDLGGADAGRITAIFADTETDEPVWVVAKLGRFSKSVVVPFIDCAAGVGEVWTPHTREEIRGAPGIDPARPLTREQELTICEHYEIHERTGRALAITGRPEGSVTSQPANDAG